MDIDTEIREIEQAIIEMENEKPINEGALNYAKSDLTYLQSLLSI